MGVPPGFRWARAQVTQGGLPSAYLLIELKDDPSWDQWTYPQVTRSRLPSAFKVLKVK